MDECPNQVFLVLKLMLFCQFRCPHKRRTILSHLKGYSEALSHEDSTASGLGESCGQSLASPSQSNITPGRRQLQQDWPSRAEVLGGLQGKVAYFSSRQGNRGHSKFMPRGGSHSFTTYQTVTLWGVPGIAPERLFLGTWSQSWV